MKIMLKFLKNAIKVSGKRLSWDNAVFFNRALATHLMSKHNTVVFNGALPSQVRTIIDFWKLVLLFKISA